MSGWFGQRMNVVHAGGATRHVADASHCLVSAHLASVFSAKKRDGFCLLPTDAGDRSLLAAAAPSALARQPAPAAARRLPRAVRHAQTSICFAASRQGKSLCPDTAPEGGRGLLLRWLACAMPLLGRGVVLSVADDFSCSGSWLRWPRSPRQI